MIERRANKGYKHVQHYGGFILKKRVKNGWETVQFKEGTMFAKTKTAWGRRSTTVTFTWKKFFWT